MSKSNAATKMDRRAAPRESLDPIEIRGFMSMDHMTLLSRTGRIIEASKTGFLLHVDREALVPKQFRETLSLEELHGDRVVLNIDLLNLEISGVIARTRRVNKDLYEIAVDYSDDSPDEWRECLLEMLPRPIDWK